MSEKPPGHLPDPTNVIGNLWVGDRFDAAKFDGLLICVLEDGNIIAPDSRSRAIWMPVLSDQVAYQSRLDAIAAKIKDSLSGKVMVYCNSGSERSPLCAAWYLSKYHDMTLEEAYRFLMSKRAIVANRTYWIKPELRTYVGT